eukprot:CAMPEP_0202694748 /NCGR_PEP_ID=MMETSP1385-20130828/8527_1 /ASSEMBLY_ACC=CAM_ASM_000861 /TAXON_ID=933848 /ORGANISM="Elphidium margaritaceum" /LENGTH=625 /DNA_ID=CAMNT_0049350647 /DNA_START=29 /DNA_END=1906 /DNA_ORIENTATION=+
MDSISANYESSDEDNDSHQNTVGTAVATTNAQSKEGVSASAMVTLAPQIDTSTSTQLEKYHDMGTTQVLHNPKADVLFGPIAGPLRKYSHSRAQEFKPKQTTLSGYVEVEDVDAFSFNEQYHTFNSFGYAMNPSNNTDDHNNNNDTQSKYVGDQESLRDHQATTIFNQSNRMIKDKRKNVRKRLRNNDPTDVDGYLGPWAQAYKTKEEEEKYQRELEKQREEWKLTQSLKKRKLEENPDKNKHKKKHKKDDDDDDDNEEDDEQQKQQRRQEARQKSMQLEKTEFHGSDAELYDYQGRTYMFCAPERRKRLHHRYNIPRKRVWQYGGHKEGVNAIRFFPKTGHLLLSASNDYTCKLWSVFDDADHDGGKRKCLRTFYGHSKGVRNICFNKQGTQFITTSYDGWLKIFDTESGKVRWRGTSGVLPFNAKFYPENESEFLCGQKNKIAVQWDTRSNRIVQRYDEHLSAVNDILFIDNNRRFVTTSDDKKIFIWDYGTPVVIKHISEPQQHSTPFITLHPNKKWFLGQSMDNKIVSYSAINKIGRLNMKKQFSGHLSAAHACQVDVSPDGGLVMSGDIMGFVYFWDWKNVKFVNKIQCHKKVTMGAAWHPTQNSLIATCSWDATIALWH